MVFNVTSVKNVVHFRLTFKLRTLMNTLLDNVYNADIWNKISSFLNTQCGLSKTKIIAYCEQFIDILNVNSDQFTKRGTKQEHTKTNKHFNQLNEKNLSVKAQKRLELPYFECLHCLGILI